MTPINRRIVLAARPEGAVKPEHFRLEELPVPAVSDGHLLVRNRFLSLDPYMRGAMNDRKSYRKPQAIGETMVVAIAAGMQPNLTLNPLEPSATITAFIVQVSLGDLPHGSVGYQSIYVAGLTLLLMTLSFNIVGFYLKRKYRTVSA
jgi:hypothetical protein